ncbi:hypothetical protein BDA96_03G004000 [Sorghum bicolor]|uniref:Uncharacterized protein n=2 Tax=Sorghum bicolor TaxID=4558 RepID=A0A921UKQ1_SORBI|nr:hypothetical protein BDA96_03G004000 [Sorghum bicolor]KXG31458.1 hypothetical protein SORBI_3003G004000 [Sorghum bicolor]
MAESILSFGSICSYQSNSLRITDLLTISSYLEAFLELLPPNSSAGTVPRYDRKSVMQIRLGITFNFSL